jgi:hypothetical protein
MPGAVPEVKNLHETRRLDDAIVDQNWGVHQLAYSRLCFDRTAHVWEALEDFEVIEYGAPELSGCRRKIGPRIGHDFLEIC